MPDATAAALLSSEAHTLTLLRQVVAAHAGQPRAAAPLLTEAIAASRGYARRRGAMAFEAETRPSGMRMPVLPDLREQDAKRARVAVAGYLKALDVAAEKKAAGESVDVPGIIGRKVELIAATEAPHAFAEERRRIEYRIVRDDPTLAGVLIKTWNAHLDRVCPVCRKLHKQSRPWGIDFTDGMVPGQVHPRCRCYSSYLPIPIVLPGSRRLQQRRTRAAQWEWVES